MWQFQRRGRPTWVLFLCLFKLSLLLKALLQISHLWGRKPVWISLCRLKSSFQANCLSQPSKMHWKGFSPVWVRKWHRSCPLLLKRFSHKGQGNFFGLLAWDGSLRCVCWWFFKWSFLLKAFLQISHLWGRKPVWMRLCRLLKILFSSESSFSQSNRSLLTDYQFKVWWTWRNKIVQFNFSKVRGRPNSSSRLSQPSKVSWNGFAPSVSASPLYIKLAFFRAV